MYKKNILSFYFIISILSVCFAQNDSLTLSYQEYIKNILTYHPIAKQSELILKNAKAQRLEAKGNLDPTFKSDWEQKNFNNKLYYRVFENKVQIPTPLGIDIVGGFEMAQGNYLNPQNNTDTYGLWNVGIEVNLLQGLIFNDRFVALKQAKVFQNIAQNEQQNLINQLIVDASSIYFQWQQFYFFDEVINENLSIAQTYFENSKKSFQSGEKTVMDTLEAYIALQEIYGLSLKNNAYLIKSSQMLDNYLWFEDMPIGLSPQAKPENIENANFNPTPTPEIPFLVNNHPMILEKMNKKTFIEIEQKMKRDKLKPKLKVKYNPLIATTDDYFNTQYSENNYKWGFTFSMPMLLRKERAGVQKGNLKIQDISFEIENKKNELHNKLESTLLQIDILEKQSIILKQNIEGYRKLLEAESLNFRMGESSVFLLNKRQEKYIESKLKLIELNTKIKMEKLNFMLYSNSLMTNFL